MRNQKTSGEIRIDDIDARLRAKAPAVADATDGRMPGTANQTANLPTDRQVTEADDIRHDPPVVNGVLAAAGTDHPTANAARPGTFRGDQGLIEREAAKLPVQFELKAFPGDKFTINKSSSYVSDGKAVLYVGILRDGVYQDFSKGSLMEIAAQIYYPSVHGGSAARAASAGQSEEELRCYPVEGGYSDLTEANKRYCTPQPTPEQLAALRQFARLEGRTWKSALRESWMNGVYRSDVDSASLQQVRNAFGPSWLVRFREQILKGDI